MAASVRSGLLKHIVKVEEEYPLNQFNPLLCGGVADYFTLTETTIELASAVKAAIDMEIPYLVIGQGEKVLFSDGGFPGLVIQNRTNSFGVAMDKSQIVVDAGLSLSSCISMAANRGLGGMTHLYGEPGTVGGALYSNLVHGGKQFSSLIRYLTVLMPPARLDTEATINRFRREWLVEPGESLTRLQKLRATVSADQPHPVILTAVLQLTSLRSEEIRSQIQRASVHSEYNLPNGVAMGPIFASPPGDVPLETLLQTAQVGKLRVEQVMPDRRALNFIRSKGSAPRSADIKQLIEQMISAVEFAHGITLTCRYEYLGVW